MTAKRIATQSNRFSVKCYEMMIRLEKLADQASDLEAACRDINVARCINEQVARHHIAEGAKKLSQASYDFGQMHDKLQEIAYAFDEVSEHMGEIS